MSIFTEYKYWDGYDEDIQDPNFEFFDRVIATTEKAVLYGYNKTQFWLPKRVHKVIRTPITKELEPGEVEIAGWADYHVIPIKTSTKRNLNIKETNRALSSLDFNDKLDFSDD